MNLESSDDWGRVNQWVGIGGMSCPLYSYLQKSPTKDMWHDCARALTKSNKHLLLASYVAAWRHKDTNQITKRRMRKLVDRTTQDKTIYQFKHDPQFFAVRLKCSKQLWYFQNRLWTTVELSGQSLATSGCWYSPKAGKVSIHGFCNFNISLATYWVACPSLHHGATCQDCYGSSQAWLGRQKHIHLPRRNNNKHRRAWLARNSDKSLDGSTRDDSQPKPTRLG